MFITIIIIISLLQIDNSLQTTVVYIDLGAPSDGNLTNFWSSTGFCPPDPKENISAFLLSRAVRINLALVGSLPNKGIKYVRVHWPLNLVKISESGERDFTDLDEFLEILDSNGLRPNFEMMGAPTESLILQKNGLFWKNLAFDVVKRYIGKFGLNNVKRWRFETWNEPDLQGYNLLIFTPTEYLEYMIGTWHGIKLAFAEKNITHGLKFGGPAGLFRNETLHPICWSALKYCQRNPKECPLTYVSFHKKGNGSSSGVLKTTLDFLDQLSDFELPVANDESDVEPDWSASREWRGLSGYPVEAFKVIRGYFAEIQTRRGRKIEVLSNDNGFLNYHPYYFTQRTLFARFQINTTHPTHSQFVKKPIYVATALFSYMEGQVLEPRFFEPDPLITIIAIRIKKTASVLFSYGGVGDNNKTKAVELRFHNPWTCKAKVAIYSVSNEKDSPYKVWKGMRSPVFPTKQQRKLLRASEGPSTVIGSSPVGSHFSVFLEVQNPSLYLVNICCRPPKKPSKVHGLNAITVTWNEVLLTWKYRKDKCIRTFEVEFRRDVTLNFTRINVNDVIFLSYQYAPEEENLTEGQYRVRAMDYWGREGPYSKTLIYSENFAL